MTSQMILSRFGYCPVCHYLSSKSKIAAAMVVVQFPFIATTADWVTLAIRAQGGPLKTAEISQRKLSSLYDFFMAASANFNWRSKTHLSEVAKYPGNAIFVSKHR